MNKLREWYQKATIGLHGLIIGGGIILVFLNFVWTGNLNILVNGFIAIIMLILMSVIIGKFFR